MIEVADILLEIEAVKLNPDNMFTWTSGIKSPIYCDNRQIISYPKHRKKIVEMFCKRISELEGVDTIAGTATAGIPWAAWIAEEMNLPMIYVRGGKKGHGLKNAIEGKFNSGQRAVVIEDLISTGSSSLEAVSRLLAAGLEVIEVQSIFNYGFEKAVKNFLNNGVSFHSLASLEDLLQRAFSKELLSNEQIGIIREWTQKTGLN